MKTESSDCSVSFLYPKLIFVLTSTQKIWLNRDIAIVKKNIKRLSNVELEIILYNVWGLVLDPEIRFASYFCLIKKKHDLIKIIYFIFYNICNHFYLLFFLLLDSILYAIKFLDQLRNEIGVTWRIPRVGKSCHGRDQMPNRVSHDRARVKVSGDVIRFRISFKDSIVIEMLKAPVMLSLAANLLKI